MRAGKLRHYVQLLLPPDPSATDSQGDPSAAWTPGPSFWAAIEPLTPREFVMASQLRADVTHSITFRWRTDITPRCKIQWDDKQTGRLRLFEIGPPLSTDERHFEQKVSAIEKWQ